MAYDFQGQSIEHDEEGFITDISLWSKDLAQYLADLEQVEMTDEHWEVVNFLRDYYNEYQIAPAIRVLVKQMKKAFGPEKGNNKYLYQLFPYGPAKQACKIAGLPKPTGCI
jgi:tRNA 2-thiouridine synthesizing protein E